MEVCQGLSVPPSSTELHKDRFVGDIRRINPGCKVTVIAVLVLHDILVNVARELKSVGDSAARWRFDLLCGSKFSKQ